jgi:hypothetical protein
MSYAEAIVMNESEIILMIHAMIEARKLIYPNES